jgi:hypothetical protein
MSTPVRRRRGLARRAPGVIAPWRTRALVRVYGEAEPEAELAAAADASATLIAMGEEGYPLALTKDFPGAID